MWRLFPDWGNYRTNVENSFCHIYLTVYVYVCMRNILCIFDLNPKEREIQTWFIWSQIMDKRICPNCGEPCEKEYETVFVHGQELCVCCNSNIEPCCEEDGFTDNILNDGGENNNVFVDFFYETGFLKSN